MLRARMLVALVLVAALGPAGARAQVGAPNVVLIVADDLGWGDLGAYGQTQIRTPHLDRLAREGMRFTSAYAGAPVCAPSRCVLLTGLDSARCPVRANVYPNQTLRVDEVTIADLLRGAGYRTSMVGKWGLGGELADGTAYQTHSTPQAMGFDASLVVLDQGIARHHWPEWLWIDGERFPLYGNVEEGHARYAPDVFLEDALREIERAAWRRERFFVYVASTLPHRELITAPDGPYATETWPEIERAYATMVSRFDDDVGRLVDRVDALGLGRDTLILVASDNGPTDVDGHRAAFFASSGPFRGGKRDLFEGGIRVPLIARWTGVVAAGAIDETPVGLVDLTPTLADLAGLGLPAGIDGISIAPLLRGDPITEQRTLRWTSYETGSGIGEEASRSALRRGDRKVIERADGRVELYDLAHDPSETNDLAAAHGAEVDALASVLRAARSQDVLPRVDPIVRALGEGVRDDTRRRFDAEGAASASHAQPVLWLRMGDDEGFAQGRVIERVRSAITLPSMVASAARGPHADAAVRAGSAAGAPNQRSVRFVRERGAHLVVPPHPALAIGGISFTVEAWVRLASRDGPQWLVSSKATRRDDRFLDFGVLARGGALPSDIARVGAEGHGLTLVFGDRRPRHGAWALASTLTIDDDLWHRVVVRVDAEAGTARFDLDGAHELVALPERAHVIGGGPLYVGAHHDAGGGIDGALDGWIDELRISRGVLADDALLDAEPRPAEPAFAVLDLGRVALGSAPIVRVVRIADVAPELARAMEGSFDLRGVTDGRLTIEGPAFRGVNAGAGGGELRVTLRPTSPGRLSAQRVIVDARVERLGYPARRSPLTLRIEGIVTTRARAATCAVDLDRGGEPLAPGALCALVTVALAARRARFRRARSA